MKLWCLLLAFFLAAAAGGCASNVPVQLAFPSPEGAAVSRTADIAIVPVTADMLSVCPALLAATTFDEGTVFDSVDICDLQAFGLPDPGTAAAFVVRVRDASNASILQGCTVADVFPGRAPIVVDLYPTDGYAAALASLVPGTTLATVCGGR
jgi:hypothetical protein